MRTTTTQKAPSQLEIERRAYFLYEKRGGQPGHELEDWLEAETQLKESPSEKARLHLSKLDAAAGQPGESVKQPARRTTESRRRETVLH